MTWTIAHEELDHGRARKYRLTRDGRPASFGDFLDACRRDGAFRTLFGQALAAAPYAGFKWEAPAVTAASVDATPFECVLLDAPGLASAEPDPSAFAEHFAPDGSKASTGRGARTSGGVVTFPNLRGDAVLVVPEPHGPPGAYGHLAAFVRRGPTPSGTPSGRRWPPRWPTGSAPTRSGSALPERACRGCTSGWTRGRSITGSSRTEREMSPGSSDGNASTSLSRDVI